MKDLKQYKNPPTLIIKPHKNFDNAKVCGYVLDTSLKKRVPVIEATCQCGGVTKIRLNNYHKTLSCGCRNSRKSSRIKFSYPNYLPYSSDINKKYNDYLKRSKARNIEFNITLEEFKNILIKPCYYCSIEMSGIDRIDSKKGYVNSNIRPCCKYCNRAKHEETEESFLKWIEAIKKL